MNHAYDEFGQGNQSPYIVGRGAHPGAVLLSPQSSAMNLSNSITSPMVLSPKMGAQSHSMFFNDVVDVQPLPQPVVAPHSSSATPAVAAAAPQQGSQATQNSTATHNSAAGSAVLSPIVQSPNQPPTLGSTASIFLDSFTRPSSSNVLGVHPKSKPQQQQQQQQQQHPSQQVPSSQTTTAVTSANQRIQQRQQQPPPQQHRQPSTVAPPPQIPNNPAVNFTQDINQLCSWLSLLSSAQQNTVVDNLLFTLHEDVLQYTKLKLNSLVKSYISPQIPTIASPVPNRDPYPLVNLDSVFSRDDVDKESHDNQILFQQWSPQPTSVTQPIFDYIKDVHQRPKSADPHVIRTTNHGPNNNNRPKRNNMGMSNNNSSNNNSSYSNTHSYGHNASHPFTSKVRAASSGDADSNGSAESSSRSASHGHIQNTSSSNNTVHSNNSNGSNGSGTHNSNNSPTNSTSFGTANITNGSSMNPKTLTDPRLLTNIPVWLKSLRLHKYSDALSNKRWDELIYLDDETLEKMGISALGARRKLLKAFAVVKEYKEQGLIDQSAYA